MCEFDECTKIVIKDKEICPKGCVNSSYIISTYSLSLSLSLSSSSLSSENKNDNNDKNNNSNININNLKRFKNEKQSNDERLFYCRKGECNEYEKEYFDYCKEFIEEKKCVIISFNLI
jgi:hypothetical protein